MPNNTKEICHAYKSKYNNERENQLISLTITDGEKSNYLLLKSEPVIYKGKSCNCAVKSLSRLFRGITSNHHGDYYCLSCFNSYTTENRLKELEEICNRNDSCRVIMPRWFEKILKTIMEKNH